MNDCNEAMVKIRMAFRGGVVDLPAESVVASNAAITARASASRRFARATNHSPLGRWRTSTSWTSTSNSTRRWAAAAGRRS